jgi:hypothetical protein
MSVVPSKQFISNLGTTSSLVKDAVVEGSFHPRSFRPGTSYREILLPALYTRSRVIVVAALIDITYTASRNPLSISTDNASLQHFSPDSFTDPLS